MSKFLIQCQELIKQDVYNCIKLVSVNVDQMQVSAIINNIGIKINVDLNVKNQLTKEYVINDLFGILIIVNVSVINHAMLENIQIMKIKNAEKNQLTSQSNNVVKTLMEIK